MYISFEEYLSNKREKLFVPPGHFYSPIVSKSVAEAHFIKIEAQPIPETINSIAVNLHEMKCIWEKLLRYLKNVPFKSEKSDGFLYRFNNPAYGYGDASVLYAMLRHLRPKSIIEIGSGWSSGCMLDTVRYWSPDTKLTFIEPHTDLLKRIMGGNKGNSEIVEEPIQNVPIELFKRLMPGDLLFIDSTHILSTGSDVHHELFEILPILRSGVIVHFHDIFRPFEYPREWVLVENRSWNDLYAPRAYLSNNPEWSIIFFNDYFAKLAAQLIAETHPAFLKSPGGAMWLQKQ